MSLLAGEDRDFVRAVAAELRLRAVRVFYDEYEKCRSPRPCRTWRPPYGPGPTFGGLGRSYVLEQLDLLTAADVVGSADALTVSLALRAVAYGAGLVDPRLGGYVQAAARSAAVD